MDSKTEIKLLKNTVKALYGMILHYRLGKTTMPEWIFAAIRKAKDVYGNDLTKI